MSTLLKLLVMSVATLLEKAFLADPNYVPRPRHLVRFTRQPERVEPLAPCAPPETAEAVAGLEP